MSTCVGVNEQVHLDRPFSRAPSTGWKQQGLIAREPCPEDRRGYYAVLTVAGRKWYREYNPGHLRALEEHFLSHIKQEEFNVLDTIFTRVLAAQGVSSKTTDKEVVS